MTMDLNLLLTNVKQYLRTAEAKQEFKHIATPEENSYIEAFHSIIQREVIERYEFTRYYVVNKRYSHTQPSTTHVDSIKQSK